MHQVRRKSIPDLKGNAAASARVTKYYQGVIAGPGQVVTDTPTLFYVQ